VGKRWQRIRKFDELSWNEQLLFSEAWFLHLTTGLILKFIPFRWIPRLFANRQRTVFSLQSSVFSQLQEILMVKRAIERANVVSPWKNRCLVSSLAGRCMLRRRKIESQLSLGVAKDSAGRTVAHAWLSAGDQEIVPRGNGYTELYFF